MITSNVPIQRMTLRQLMTHAEKLARDLNEYVTVELLGKLSDLHELSRPVRRKSQYPTIAALQNSVDHVDEAINGLLKRMEHAKEAFDLILQQGARSRSK
jgi:hypothetical protein